MSSTSGPPKPKRGTFSVKKPHTHVRIRPENYVGDCSHDKRVRIVFEPVPEEAAPTEAAPTEAAPTEAAPAVDVVAEEAPAAPTAPTAPARSRSTKWRARVIETTVPHGFTKIIEEALDNVYDNDTRPESGQTSATITLPDTVVFTGARKDPVESKIAITVANNGNGIPVLPYEANEGDVALPPGTTVPEAIFNHFLSGSNYDDSQQRSGGGRNGIGIKATNALSTDFKVDIKDPVNGKSFSMTWADGMESASKPSVRSRKAKAGGVTVSFVPDFGFFKLKSWEPDTVALVQSRVAELAACIPKSKIKYNGMQHPFCNKFEKLARAAAECLGASKVGKGVKIACGEDAAKNPTAVGIKPGLTAYVFVRPAGVNEDVVPNLGYTNGIACLGNHVEAVISAVGTAIREDVAKALRRDAKGFRISRTALRNVIWVAVRATVPNPEFESQSKLQLTTTTTGFKFRVDASDAAAALKRAGVVRAVVNVIKNGISAVETRVANAAMDDASRFSSTIGIAHYDRALNAGKKGANCTLILTEGLSAKNLAVSMLTVLGRDNYGIKPMRGKGVNILKTPKYANTNREFIDLCKILRLRVGMVFTTRADAMAVIPYTKIMLMADQDKDGGHICGLILASFHAIFPSLLRVVPDLFVRFITPVVRVRQSGRRVGPIDFFSEPEFESWRECPEGAAVLGARGTTVKRYKGLGTSKREEAVEYAKDLARHTIVLKYDPTASADSLMLAFGPSVSPRRDALEDPTFAHDPLDYGKTEMSITEYVEGEVWEYHRESVRRGILGEDGHKECNRKALYVMMEGQKRGDADGAPGKWVRGDTKVDALASLIAAHSQYKYGPKSIEDAVPKMAQDYIGTNNLSLFVPSGQFSSRVATKDDHASSRYILSRMNPIARYVYPEADDPVMERRLESNGPAEPVCYHGCINLGLVNGTDLAIGTGYMYTTPMHNPRDVIAATRAWIGCHADVGVLAEGGGAEVDGGWRKAFMDLVPWYRWFKGTVTKLEDEVYELKGLYQVTPGRKAGTTVITVTELPPGTWTDKWKDTIEKKLAIRKKDDDKELRFIRDIEDAGDDIDVCVRLVCSAKDVNAIPGSKLEELLDLKTKVNRGSIPITYLEGDTTCETVSVTYPTIADWIDAWARKRFALYKRRVRHQIAEGEALVYDRSERYKFIKAVVDNELVIRKRPKADVVADLVAMGLRSDEEVASRMDPGTGTADPPVFQRLLGMAINSMTKERLDALSREIEDATTKVEELKTKTVFCVWNEDLDLLEKALDVYDKTTEERWKSAAKTKRRK